MSFFFFFETQTAAEIDCKPCALYMHAMYMTAALEPYTSAYVHPQMNNYNYNFCLYDSLCIKQTVFFFFFFFFFLCTFTYLSVVPCNVIWGNMICLFIFRYLHICIFAYLPVPVSVSCYPFVFYLCLVMQCMAYSPGLKD